MTKIIYIAGYGRSGSTVLDIILGNHSQITGVGEISRFLESWSDQNHKCSCGMTYDKCVFWSGLNLKQGYLPNIGRVIRKLEKLSHLPYLLLGFVSNEDRKIYKCYQENLFDHIRSHTNKPLIIDSSKSSWPFIGRFWALSKIAKLDVYVIHLIRNGLYNLQSLTVTGSNRALEGFTSTTKWPTVRAVVGWVSTNVFVSLLGRLLGSKHYLKLRYEDFIADPETVLEDIGQLCGFDPMELIKRINRNDDFPVGHRVSGNRIRLLGKIQLQKNFGKNKKCILKFYQFLLFTLLGGYLNWLYGYGWPNRKSGSKGRKISKKTSKLDGIT